MIKTVLLFAALLCFVLAAFKVSFARIDLTPLGLALLTVAVAVVP